MRLLRPFLLIAVPAIAVAAALLWYLWGGRYVGTENAYVKADIVHVAAEVSGRVVEIGVKDHGVVKPGDMLVKIDPEPYKMALEKAEAELDQTRARVEAMRAEYHEAVAEQKEADEKIQFYEAQRARQTQLVNKGVGFAFRFEEAGANAEVAARAHRQRGRRCSASWRL